MNAKTVSSTDVLHEALSENMIDGLVYGEIVFDASGQPVDCLIRGASGQIEALTWTRETAKKRTADHISEPNWLNSEPFAAYARVARSGQPECFELFVKSLNRLFLVSVYTPGARYFIATFHNVSDRKRMEKDLEDAIVAARNVLEDLAEEKDKLAEAKAKDEAMLASIGDGVIIVDLVGNITFINDAAQDFLGWRSREVVGKLLFDVVPMENEKGVLIPAEAQPLAAALATGASAFPPKKVFRGIYYRRKNKTKFPVAINASPVLLEDKMIGAIEVFRDITREKEIDLAKTEFVSLASHQLRTPLTTVNWYSEVLLNDGIGSSPEKQRDYLGKIHAGSERMVALVNTFLNVSRIELGTLPVESKQVDIGRLLREVVAEQAPQADAKGIVLANVFSENIPKLQSDSGMLRMIFQNLLSNAIKYTPPDGRVEIRLSANKKGSVLVVISDTGYGIPKNDQKMIFTKLFRGGNIKDLGEDGTGLGLYLVRAVLTALGGSVRFTSRQNKGSNFFVTLPVKKQL